MHSWVLALIVGQALDCSTSLYGFQHGAGERNPFVVSTQTAPFVAQVATFTAVEVVFLDTLSHHHPKLARGLAYVQIGGSLAAVVNNTLVARRLH